jgi:predicted transcriptional regulator
MEEKGHLKHRAEGKQYVFSATTPHRKAAKSALRRVLETFFAGSLEKAIVMHLTEPGTRISEQEAVRLMELIRQARERGT